MCLVRFPEHLLHRLHWLCFAPVSISYAFGCITLLLRVRMFLLHPLQMVHFLVDKSSPAAYTLYEAVLQGPSGELHPGLPRQATSLRFFLHFSPDAPAFSFSMASVSSFANRFVSSPHAGHRLACSRRFVWPSCSVHPPSPAKSAHAWSAKRPAHLAPAPGCLPNPLLPARIVCRKRVWRIALFRTSSHILLGKADACCSSPGRAEHWSSPCFSFPAKAKPSGARVQRCQ